jgi:hypothetical protein
MIMTQLERRSHRYTVTSAQRLKREVGYNPTRFLQMVGELGGPGAARKLLQGRDAGDGFTTLWEHRRLDVSVEAFVLLLPWYQELFSDAERDAAERRLTEHGFGVERFVIAAGELAR